MTVSRRERFLIILLAATVVFLGGFKLLIEPKLKDFRTARTALNEALSQKNQAENNALETKNLTDENAALETKIDSSAEAFFPELENNAVQIFFQQLADASSVTFSTFEMKDKVATQISNYYGEDGGLTYPAKDAANGLSNIKNENAEKDPAPSAPSGSAKNSAQQQKGEVEMMVVTMKFESTYEQGLSLIDAIVNSGRTVRISSVDIKSQAGGQVSFNIAAECYGVVKLSNTDPLLNASLPSPSGKTNPFQ